MHNLADKHDTHVATALRALLALRQLLENEQPETFMAWKYGAIVLEPLTGLSDVICDLTATGKTLQEHELTILDKVFESTAHFFANPVDMKVHYLRLRHRFCIVMAHRFISISDIVYMLRTLVVPKQSIKDVCYIDLEVLKKKGILRFW